MTPTQEMATVEYRIIPYDKANVRIVLHPNSVSSSEKDVYVTEDAYVTVEELEHCALGAPQWRCIEDSRQAHIPAWVVIPLVISRFPSAFTACETTWLGSCETSEGAVRVCTVHRGDGYSLVTERLGKDMVGGPRWNRMREVDVMSHGEAQPGCRVTPSLLLDCLFPDD